MKSLNIQLFRLKLGKYEIHWVKPLTISSILCLVAVLLYLSFYDLKVLYLNG